MIHTSTASIITNILHRRNHTDDYYDSSGSGSGSGSGDYDYSYYGSGSGFGSGDNADYDYSGSGDNPSLGGQAGNCWYCLGTNPHGIANCEKVHFGHSTIVNSPSGYCQTVTIVNQTGANPGQGQVLELIRSPAYIIAEEFVNADSIGTNCMATNWEGTTQYSTPTDNNMLKCIDVCYGDQCNDSSSPFVAIRDDAIKNDCYSLSCGDNQRYSIDNCDLSLAANTSGHSSCFTQTSFDQNGNVITAIRGVNSMQQNVDSTFGYCNDYDQFGKTCYQNCIGNFCNQNLLSEKAVCLMCNSVKGSLDFEACLHSNADTQALVGICPYEFDYCVTRQAFNAKNKTIAIEKGCSDNSTALFFNDRAVPLDKECWVINQNSLQEEVSYVCSQLYSASPDVPVNDHELVLGNFQEPDPTLPPSSSWCLLFDQQQLVFMLWVSLILRF